MRRMVVHFIMALVLLLAARTAVADPLAATAELRAIACCATHCHHETHPTGAAQCCGVSSPTDAAIGSAVPRVPDHGPRVARVVETKPASLLALPADAASVLGGDRGPPRFLALRVLRL